MAKSIKEIKMLLVINTVGGKLKDMSEEIAKLVYKKVGLTYVQYFGKPSPAEIYGGTWKAIYDNSSVFFRTPGANSLPFNGNVQGDAMRQVIGKVFGYTDGSYHARSFSRADGVFNALQDGTEVSSPGHSTRATNGGALIFDISRQVPVANEIRPMNVTVRIWECIS